MAHFKYLQDLVNGRKVDPTFDKEGKLTELGTRVSQVKTQLEKDIDPQKKRLGKQQADQAYEQAYNTTTMRIEALRKKQEELIQEIHSNEEKQKGKQQDKEEFLSGILSSNGKAYKESAEREKNYNTLSSGDIEILANQEKAFKTFTSATGKYNGRLGAAIKREELTKKNIQAGKEELRVEANKIGSLGVLAAFKKPGNKIEILDEESILSILKKLGIDDNPTSSEGSIPPNPKEIQQAPAKALKALAAIDLAIQQQQKSIQELQLAEQDLVKAYKELLILGKNAIFPSVEWKKMSLEELKENSLKLQKESEKYSKMLAQYAAPDIKKMPQLQNSFAADLTKAHALFKKQQQTAKMLHQSTKELEKVTEELKSYDSSKESSAEVLKELAEKKLRAQQENEEIQTQQYRYMSPLLFLEHTDWQKPYVSSFADYEKRIDAYKWALKEGYIDEKEYQLLTDIALKEQLKKVQEIYAKGNSVSKEQAQEEPEVQLAGAPNILAYLKYLRELPEREEKNEEQLYDYPFHVKTINELYNQLPVDHDATPRYHLESFYRIDPEIFDPDVPKKLNQIREKYVPSVVWSRNNIILSEIERMDPKTKEPREAIIAAIINAVRIEDALPPAEKWESEEEARPLKYAGLRGLVTTLLHAPYHQGHADVLKQLVDPSINRITYKIFNENAETEEFTVEDVEELFRGFHQELSDLAKSYKTTTDQAEQLKEPKVLDVKEFNPAPPDGKKATLHLLSLFTDLPLSPLLQESKKHLRTMPIAQRLENMQSAIKSLEGLMKPTVGSSEGAQLGATASENPIYSELSPRNNH